MNMESPDSCAPALSSPEQQKVSSPFRPRRFEQQTRRQAMERRFRTKPKSVDGTEGSVVSQGSTVTTATSTRIGDCSETTVPTRPQHYEESYYRIVYRGVVALLSAPETSAPRSGAYVSYAEIVVVGEETPLSSSEGKVLRVARVLTGGYAVDDPNLDVVETPKRSNAHTLPLVGPSPLPASSGIVKHTAEQVGYLFTHRSGVTIAERIERPPICELGTFLYKIVSSTPIPILTGPSSDAPMTKAMLLPGTIHEVYLRLGFVADAPDETVWFLRLARRRGWIADRKVSRTKTALSAKEISEEEQHSFASPQSRDDHSISILSTASTAITATPGSTARRRHRPPRRKRENKEDVMVVPRLVGPPSRSATPLRNLAKTASYETPTKAPPEHNRLMTPTSNVSMLSDDSSLDHSLLLQQQQQLRGMVIPDRSAPPRSANNSVDAATPSFFLMRVNAPRGLAILDAPHFQVNNLIHGKHPTPPTSPPPESNSIFQTMGSHQTTTVKIATPAIFDSTTKTRRLVRGAVFEASKRMERPLALTQGSGLIKLSDNSGWAIVPRQEDLDVQYRHYHGGVASIKEGEATRAFEELGNAVVGEQPGIWVRVASRTGVRVSCPPPMAPLLLGDPSSSPPSSAGCSSTGVGVSTYGPLRSRDSDVASSVGSAFLDAMFRTPKKSTAGSRQSEVRSVGSKSDHTEKHTVSTIIPCGMCVEVEPWEDSSDHTDQHAVNQDYARLVGGQGWIPLKANGRRVSESIPKPKFRFGSFWFRVQTDRGLKARQGPSRKAPSIKSDDGVYFRFECGEFLRASEIVTVTSEKGRSECFAKLYRNRHVRLHTGQESVRSLPSMTAAAEWVLVHSEDEAFLEECEEPRIERHRQGWRYNVIRESGIEIRKGPSFSAEATGVDLLGGESVLISERVTGPGERITWLRIKDGQGWVHDVGQDGEPAMIAHSLRHRTKITVTRPKRTARLPGKDEISYNAIIARLFDNDIPNDAIRAKDIKGLQR